MSLTCDEWWAELNKSGRGEPNKLHGFAYAFSTAGPSRGNAAMMGTEPDLIRWAWDFSREQGLAEGEAKLREFGKRLREIAQHRYHPSGELCDWLLALAKEADPPEEAKE